MLSRPTIFQKHQALSGVGYGKSSCRSKRRIQTGLRSKKFSTWKSVIADLLFGSFFLFAFLASGAVEGRVCMHMHRLARHSKIIMRITSTSPQEARPQAKFHHENRGKEDLLLRTLHLKEDRTQHRGGRLYVLWLYDLRVVAHACNCT